MPIEFRYAARSDVGMVRTNNEDSGYAGPHLLVLADGMGGHAGGEVASSIAVGALVDLDDESFSANEASAALLDRIHLANAEMQDRMRAEPRLAGMGTTLIALLRARDKFVLAHIGDSRAYLGREGTVIQVTKDHSFVQTLVDEGRLTQEEAQTHPQRSLVTRVLTGAVEDEPDLVARQGRVGDRYLLCSDGLSDYVARDTIDEVLLGTPDPGDCADRLVTLALRAGAPDNVTIVIGDVVDSSSGEAPPTQPEIVGAASIRERGTRPMPVTPAEKAAALTALATAPAVEEEAELQLAEEGPRSGRSRFLRAVAFTTVIGVVIAGTLYASWAWTQQQFYVAANQGVVTIFRGVHQDLGPVSLSRVEATSDIAVDDLPDSYQTRLAQGVSVDDRAAADALVADLDLQARACVYAESQGEDCKTVPPTWTTPTPTPTAPTPTGTSTSSATPSPSVTPAAATAPRTTSPARPA